MPNLARLRVVVANLGEASLPPWWQTQFTTPVGLDFSTYNFVHSHVSAAINGAAVAARSIHDERIGRKGTRHLFRFDGGLERAVHRHILEADQGELEAMIRDRDSAMTVLAGLCRQRVDAPEGPVQIGILGKEEEDEAVAELAAHYLSGFESGRPVFPYFAQSK